MKKTKRNYTNRVVTRLYRAPELLLGETAYGSSIDVWSIGCVFSELLNGVPLFNGRTDNEQVEKIFEKCGIPNEARFTMSVVSREAVPLPIAMASIL